MAPYPDHTDYSSPTSSTADRHRDGAAASSTYMPIPSQYGPLPPPITRDDNGNIVVVYFDPNGNVQTSTITTGTSLGKDGSHYTSTAPTAQGTVSSYSSYLMSSATSSNGPSGAATSSGFPIAASGPEQQDQDHPHHPPFPAVAAVGIIIPFILIVLSLCGFFFCIRPRRRKNGPDGTPVVAAHRVPEMKHVAGRGGPMEHSQHAAGGSAPSSSAVVSPSTSSNARSPGTTGTPPVILSTTMNNTYYTGIDTSDHISLTDQRSEASADTFGEEPPPPYRPRSVPPISRETSVRNSMCRNTSVRSSRNDPLSGANLMGVRRSVDVRSPFDDPDDSDDDRLSQISTIRSLPRHDTDRLSVVSDMSYQEEPTSTHSAV